jgi:predicted PurR-regulated permease PerM
MQPLVSNTAYSVTTRWVLIAVLVVTLLAAAWFIRGILMLILASVILVVLFTMPIRVLVRRGMQRVPATILSLIFISIAVLLLAAVALPTLVQQFNVLATRIIPSAVDTLVGRWSSGELQQQFPILQSLEGVTTRDLENLINTLSGQFAGALGQLSVQVLPVLGGVVDTVLSVLIVIFLSVYLLADPQMHQEGLIRLFPLWYRHRVREIVNRLDVTLRGWLRATIISMAFVLVATWFGLTLLGIQQAAALGVLAGVLSFIPNFGPILALIPALAVGILQAPDNIGWIILVIYGVSFLQSQVVTPLLVQGSIRLPPVLVLLGQIVAGAFLGFLGIMLAVPITAILMVLVQEVYVKDVLGDKAVSEVPVPEKERQEKTLLLPDRA